jgi:hypothetical protein
VKQCNHFPRLDARAQASNGFVVGTWPTLSFAKNRNCDSTGSSPNRSDSCGTHITRYKFKSESLVSRFVLNSVHLQTSISYEFFIFLGMDMLSQSSSENVANPSSSFQNGAQQSLTSNLLKSSSLSRSMPNLLEPGGTAEDEDVLSMRACRYRELDNPGAMDMPPPRKYVNATTTGGGLTRSKSECDFRSRTDSLSRY